MIAGKLESIHKNLCRAAGLIVFMLMKKRASRTYLKDAHRLMQKATDDMAVLISEYERSK